VVAEGRLAVVAAAAAVVAADTAAVAVAVAKENPHVSAAISLCVIRIVLAGRPE
jgi:hypothetical protein